MVEDTLARLFHRQHVILFGRARSALCSLLRVVAPGRDSPVLLPSNACPVLPACVLAAGARPVLVPVSPADGLVADDAMAEIVEAAPQPGVAVVTHLYGFLAEAGRTVQAARRRGWFVVANDTLAATAAAGQAAEGDAVLVSFGSGKTIDAGGGGALLVDDDRLAEELRRSAARLPPLDEAALQREEAAALLFRRLRTSGRSEAIEDHLPALVADSEHSFPESLRPALADALTRWRAEVEAASGRAGMWRAALQGIAGLDLPRRPQPVPWRLVATLAPTDRDRVVEALRQGGFDAGTNFPPLHDSFPRQFGPCPPDAEAWGQRVLNLWTSEGYTPARISAAAALVAECLSPRSAR